MLTVNMTRDSVCMADDIDAPHHEVFELPAPATLLDLGRHLARSSYLPMQLDSWGWIIEAGAAAVVIRPKLIFLRRVARLFGNPAGVKLETGVNLFAARSQDDRLRHNGF